MAKLTDLPDELLLEIFTYSFLPAAPQTTLQSHLTTHRLYALAHEAFYTQIYHYLSVHPTTPPWDAGTLLHEIYSPTFSAQNPLRNTLAFVTQVQNLRVEVSLEDEGQVNTAVYEVVRELRRYPRLRRVELEVCILWCEVREGLRDALVGWIEGGLNRVRVFGC